jgi:hypothetical protein
MKYFKTGDCNIEHCPDNYTARIICSHKTQKVKLVEPSSPIMATQPLNLTAVTCGCKSHGYYNCRHGDYKVSSLNYAGRSNKPKVAQKKVMMADLPKRVKGPYVAPDNVYLPYRDRGGKNKPVKPISPSPSKEKVPEVKKPKAEPVPVEQPKPKP